MPSLIVGAQSGGVPLVSGAIWSGNVVNKPNGGIQLRADFSNSGVVYVAYSGNVTIASGGALSSGGMMDGMPVGPGDGYFVPKLAIMSGQPNVWFTVPAAISGFARIFWETD